MESAELDALEEVILFNEASHEEPKGDNDGGK